MNKKLLTSTKSGNFLVHLKRAHICISCYNKNLSFNGNHRKECSLVGWKILKLKSSRWQRTIIGRGFQPFTIITKHFILDVAAALDPPLIGITMKKYPKHNLGMGES